MQPPEWFCLVAARDQDISATPSTHESKLRKFLACFASFVTTATGIPTLHSVNLQFSFVAATRKSSTSASRLTQTQNFQDYLHTSLSISLSPCQLACSFAVTFHLFRKQASGNITKISFYHLSFYSNARETGQNPFY